MMMPGRLLLLLLLNPASSFSSTSFLIRLNCFLMVNSCLLAWLSAVFPWCVKYVNHLARCGKYNLKWISVGSQWDYFMSCFPTVRTLGQLARYVPTYEEKGLGGTVTVSWLRARCRSQQNLIRKMCRPQDKTQGRQNSIKEPKYGRLEGCEHNND